MYSISVRCSDHKKCSERARLGPPDSDCLLNEKSSKKDRKKMKDSQGNSNYAECEFADDAINLDKKHANSYSTSLYDELGAKDEYNQCITVNGKEELPCIHKYYFKDTSSKKDDDMILKNADHSPAIHNKLSLNKDKINRNLNGNFSKGTMKNVYGYCTLPKNKKKSSNSKMFLKHIIPPKRITPDGTHIYYWCDVQKKQNSGECLL